MAAASAHGTLFQHILRSQTSDEWEAGTEQGVSGTWGWRSRLPGIGADRQSLGTDADCGIPHPPEAYLIRVCGLLTLAKHSRSSPVARRLAARGVQSMSVTTFMLTDSSMMGKLIPAETHKT